MLLSSPFSHRRHLLRTLFPPFSDPDDLYLARFAHIESIDSTNCTDVQAEMQAFFADVVQQKCEGLMVKLLESGEVSAADGAEESDLSELEDEEGDGSKPKKRSKAANKAQEEAKEVKAGTRKPRPSTYEPDQRTMGWLKVKKGKSISGALPASAHIQKTTWKVSETAWTWCRSGRGGVKAGKQAGGPRSCSHVTTPRPAPSRRCANVSRSRAEQR